MIVIIIITFVISVLALNDASRANNRLDDSIVAVQESGNLENTISDVEYTLKRMSDFSPNYDLPISSESVYRQYPQVSDENIGLSDRDIIKPLRWAHFFQGKLWRRSVYKKDDDDTWSKCANEDTYQSNKEYKVSIEYILEGDSIERSVTSDFSMKPLSPSSISNAKGETVQKRAILLLSPFSINNFNMLGEVSLSCNGESLRIFDNGTFDIPKSWAGKELSVKSKLKYKDDIYERMYTVAEFDDE
jgi:hypothetical protein